MGRKTKAEQLDEFVATVLREVEARDRRRRAEQLKHQLNARHASGPDEYLSDSWAGFPTNTPKLPAARVQWITELPAKSRRPHRATKNQHGRPQFDDAALAAAVEELKRLHGIGEHEAVRAVAVCLTRDCVGGYPPPKEEAARVRVRRALKRRGVHYGRAITHASVRLR